MQILGLRIVKTGSCLSIVSSDDSDQSCAYVSRINFSRLPHSVPYSQLRRTCDLHFLHVRFAQRQRFAAARALAMEPGEILMDALQSNLDALLHLEMRVKFKGILAESKTAERTIADSLRLISHSG